MALVLCVISLFAAMLAADYRPLVLRARTAEAHAAVQAIANAEQAYFRDRGKYLACAPSADVPPRGVAGRFDATKPGWAAVGFRVDGPALYQYEVKLTGNTYDVIARGDLNGDGVPSTFTLHGADLRLDIDQELE